MPDDKTQQPATDPSNVDDSFNKGGGKYVPVLHTTHTQDTGPPVGPKHQAVDSNVDMSNKEEGEYTPVSHIADYKHGVGPKVYLKQNPSFNKEVDQSNKGKGDYFPMSKEDTKDFRKVVSFQNSKSASNPVRDSENVTAKETDKSSGMTSQAIAHYKAVKQPRQSKGQGNEFSDNYATKAKKVSNSMHLSVNHAPLNSVKDFENESSEPSSQESEQSKDKNGIHTSSSARLEPNISHENQIDSSAETSQSSNQSEPSNYGNSINEGNQKLGKTVLEVNQDSRQANGRIDEGTMKSIPSDKIDNMDNRKKQNGFSSVDGSLRVEKPAFTGKVPTDVAKQEPNVLQHQSKNFANGINHKQGIEIRIRPGGIYMPKQFKNIQKVESSPVDMVKAEHKPAETPKQNFQHHDHDPGKTVFKGKESSPNTLQRPQNGKDDEQGSSMGQPFWQEVKGAQLIGNGSQKDGSENGKGSHSAKGQLDKSLASKYNPNAVDQLKTSPQQKQSDKEKQDFGQTKGKESATSNHLQGPTFHQGKKVGNTSPFSNKGNALSVTKENPAENQSFKINEQGNPKKEDHSATTGKMNQAQQVSDSSKAVLSGEGTKVQKTPEGNKNGNQESDEGQKSQEEGEPEPVPVVDLNNASPANGEDYGPATSQVFSGPVEDTGAQNQPEPDSQGESQPSGPVYDNEAIQGLSEMSQRADQNILQQTSSVSQERPDQPMGTGYDEMSMSKAYAGEPVVDLNRVNLGNGAGYGPSTSQSFSGPVEDTRAQNEPEPDSQGASQSSGSVYDNKAIQGLRAMSQRAFHNLLQKSASASQEGDDQSMGTGYDEMSLSKAYAGGIPSEKVKEDFEDDTSMQRQYQDRNQNQAPLTSDYYNTEPADDCLCPRKGKITMIKLLFLVGNYDLSC